MSYRQKERTFYKWTYELRNSVYAPILKFLSGFGIRANHITYVRGLIIIWFMYEMFVRGNLVSATIIYLVFWLLDTFDGALARFHKLESDKGKFNDVFIDQVGYALFTMGLAFLDVANPFILFYHVIVSGALYVAAIAYKNENVKSDWIIRPEANATYFKIIVNTFVIVLVLFKVNVLDIIFIIVNIWMTISMIYNFAMLQRQKYTRNT